MMTSADQPSRYPHESDLGVAQHRSQTGSNRLDGPMPAKEVCGK
jgi:hypothetical protein